MIERDFKNALEGASLSTKDKIIGDGKIHRFHVIGDKKQSKNGWYVLYADAIPAGAFGCWKRGINETWCYLELKKLSRSEQQNFQKQMQEARKLHQAETKKRQAEAARKARYIYAKAEPAQDNHPYLINKCVRAHEHIKITKDAALVIPLMDIESNIHSLQFIDSDGNKRFLGGGRIKGCFFGISGDTDTLCICEGYATGASIHNATGHSVACAMNAVNLLPVAEAFRKKYPDKDIVICADNDTETQGNPGLTKARESALAIDARLAVPPISGDFNDYYNGVCNDKRSY